jgi:hypothetical protein
VGRIAGGLGAIASIPALGSVRYQVTMIQLMKMILQRIEFLNKRGIKVKNKKMN